MKNKLQHKRYIVVGLAASLFLLFAALPALQSALKNHNFYGHMNRYSVPEIPGAPVPAGGFNIVFFGFGQCARVCPAQMVNLIKLQEYVDPDKVHFVYVALDADRQDQEQLSNMFKDWGPSFRAVVPDSVSASQQLAFEYGGFAFERRNRAPDSERFEHDGRLYVTSEANRVELSYLSTDLEIDRIVDDLSMLSSGRE